MKLIFISLCFIFNINYSISQTLISNNGGFNKNSSNCISWSFGEVAIKTLYNSDIIITQGFQQSKMVITSIGDSYTMASKHINLFPNPTNSTLNIEIKGELSNELTLWLYNVNGELSYQTRAYMISVFIVVLPTRL